MRAILGIATALILVLGGLGGMGCCLHDTCDCCQDACSSCCTNGGHYYLGAPAGGVHAAPKAEEIKKLPAPTDGAKIGKE